MYSTIIFFMALLLSILFGIRMIRGFINKIGISTFDIIQMIMISSVWSWLFHLLH